MQSTLKQRLAAGKMVRVFWVGNVPSAKLIEVVGSKGDYHAVWIDEEHAALSQETIEHMVLACRAAGLPCYVRLAATSYAAMMRPLEIGADGVMAAQIFSADHAREIVKWSRFPPLGQRGLNTSNFEGDWGLADPAEFLPRSNKERWLAVQIETAQAVEEVEDIANIEGIDHLFVGPADLSVALGVPGQFLHEKCQSALRRVSAACQRAGKSWGILVRGAEHGKLCQELGCQLFALAGDLSILHAGLAKVKEGYQELFDVKD